jgi:soluble lytic murein transglycosylase-like protein
MNLNRPFRAVRWIAPVALLLLAAGTVRADTAFLRNGRSIEIAAYEVAGERIVLRLAGGGEMVLPAADVVEIRREPREAPPVAPQPETPQDIPAATRAVPGASVVSAAPEASVASDPAAATGTAPDPARTGAVPPPTPGAQDPLLPIGGVFDQGALQEMAGRIARRHGVDDKLVLAVIQVESRYDAFAVSPRGAMGLMQLMPKTAARFEVTNAFDPVQNVEGGVRYLKELLERYSGQVRLALAAYNAGEEAVERHSGIPPYRETVDYVRRVMAARR